MKRIYLILFVILFLGLFLGCSGKIEEAQSNSSPDITTPSATPTEDQNKTDLQNQTGLHATPRPPTLLPPPPQPPMPHLPPGDIELTGKEREEAIGLALNNSKVREWLEEGYEIVNVTKSESGTAWVCILTRKQILPWIVGITIKVPVDLKNKHAQGEAINFEMALASLTEEQKEETRKIALSDPDVRERIGSDYEVTDVDVMAYSYCYHGCYPKAYPAVFIKSNPEPCRYGMDFAVLVDLKEEKVVDVLSYYRKPSPECLNSS